MRAIAERARPEVAPQIEVLEFDPGAAFEVAGQEREMGAGVRQRAPRARPHAGQARLSAGPACESPPSR